MTFAFGIPRKDLIPVAVLFPRPLPEARLWCCLACPAAETIPSPIPWRPHGHCSAVAASARLRSGLWHACRYTISCACLPSSVYAAVCVPDLLVCRTSVETPSESLVLSMNSKTVQKCCSKPDSTVLRSNLPKCIQKCTVSALKTCHVDLKDMVELMKVTASLIELPDCLCYCAGSISGHGLQGRVFDNMLDGGRQVGLAHLPWAWSGGQGEAL